MGILKKLFGKKQPKKPNQNVKTSKDASKKSSSQPMDESIERTHATADPEENKHVQAYHVSRNTDETSDYYKMWRVRKAHSDKTIKHFKTQAEAITYAKTLAKKHRASLVIHKLDGSIRKQNYGSN